MSPDRVQNAKRCRNPDNGEPQSHNRPRHPQDRVHATALRVTRRNVHGAAVRVTRGDCPGLRSQHGRPRQSRGPVDAATAWRSHADLAGTCAGMEPVTRTRLRQHWQRSLRPLAQLAPVAAEFRVMAYLMSTTVSIFESDTASVYSASIRVVAVRPGAEPVRYADSVGALSRRPANFG